MQNYLRRFYSENDYSEFEESTDFVTPNVSIIRSDIVSDGIENVSTDPITVIYNPYTVS